MTKNFYLSRSVESLFEHWPETVQLFLQHQMACPGCHLAGFESLEGALKVYRIKHKPFLDDLNQIVAAHKCSDDQDQYQKL